MEEVYIERIKNYWFIASVRVVGTMAISESLK